MSPYEERVSSGAMTALALAMVVLVTLAALGALLVPSFWAAVGGAALWLLMVGVAIVFSVIFIRVDDRAFTARFRLFGKTIPLEDIERVEVADYTWTEFGGWGWRYNLSGGQALSILGAPRCVVIHRRGGGRALYVSTHQPVAVKAAIEARRPAATS